MFDIIRPRRADRHATEFVRVPLNFSAPEPPATTAHGGPAAQCSRIPVLSQFLNPFEAPVHQRLAAQGGPAATCSVLSGSSSHSLKTKNSKPRSRMRSRCWLVVAVAQQAAPLNPLRRLLRRPPPVSDAHCLGLCGITFRAYHASTRRASVAPSARWRGDSTPSTRRCPRDRADGVVT